LTDTELGILEEYMHLKQADFSKQEIERMISREIHALALEIV